MKNKLESLYAQILLNEAEKSNLQNPSNDTVGTLPTENVFGKKPEVKDKELTKFSDKDVEDAEESDREVTDPEADVTPAASGTNTPGLKVPSKSGEAISTKKQTLGDSLQPMSAFENLFRKTLVTEEGEETPELEIGTEAPEMEEAEVEQLEGAEDEEGDLLSDLHDLHSRIADIISKLEQAVEESEHESSEEGTYSDEDFEDEFGGDEESEEEVKEESVKLTAVSPSKGKSLTKKSNQVGKIKAKTGKANGLVNNKVEDLKALGNEKGKSLTKHNNVVKTPKLPKKGDHLFS